MEFTDMMRAEKESEDDYKIVYRYGHLAYGNTMTGKLSVTKSEYPSISTIQLEDGYETRVNEMRIGTKIIMDHLQTGEWPEKTRLV